MSDDLNRTIDDLARTTRHGRQELNAIASAYPDADFLKFVVASWASGVRLAAWQLAVFFYNPQLRADERGSTEQGGDDVSSA